MPMTASVDRVEVITSVQRRSADGGREARIVQETYAPGMCHWWRGGDNRMRSRIREIERSAVPAG